MLLCVLCRDCMQLYTIELVGYDDTDGQPAHILLDRWPHQVVKAHHYCCVRVKL